MNSRSHVDRDPEIIGGKPKIRCTRLGVGTILGRLGDGWTAEQLIDAYPAITAEKIQACQAFAAEMLATDEVVDIPHGDGKSTIVGATP